jgi:hypothetical protein
MEYAIYTPCAGGSGIGFQYLSLRGPRFLDRSSAVKEAQRVQWEIDDAHYKRMWEMSRDDSLKYSGVKPGWLVYLICFEDNVVVDILGPAVESPWDSFVDWYAKATLWVSLGEWHAKAILHQIRLSYLNIEDRM